MTAFAGLETEKAYPDLTFYCGGSYLLQGFKDRLFHCYEGRAHGTLNLPQP